MCVGGGDNVQVCVCPSNLFIIVKLVPQVCASVNTVCVVEFKQGMCELVTPQGFRTAVLRLQTVSRS